MPASTPAQHNMDEKVPYLTFVNRIHEVFGFKFEIYIPEHNWFNISVFERADETNCQRCHGDSRLLSDGDCTSTFSSVQKGWFNICHLFDIDTDILTNGNNGQ